MTRLIGAPVHRVRVIALSAALCAALLPLGGCLGGDALDDV